MLGCVCDLVKLFGGLGGEVVEVLESTSPMCIRRSQTSSGSMRRRIGMPARQRNEWARQSAAYSTNADYPAPPAKLEWQALGTMNELVSVRYSLR